MNCRRILLGLFCLQLLAIGCVRAEDEAGIRILEGTTVPASTFPTVGGVGDDSGIFCTGTLIAPDVVLCACHCVQEDNGQQSLGDTEGRFTLNGVVYKTKDIIVHPTYNGFQGDEEDQVDISLLILETPVPNVTPTPIYRNAPTVGTVLTLAGYGEQGTGTDGGNGTYPGDGVINTGKTPIDEVTNTFIKWTFDRGESDTAGGDSGGPAFIDVNGVLHVAGVTSGGTGGGFGNTSYDARVDKVAAWIDSITGNTGTPNPGTGGLTLTSAPTATPNPAAIGQSVTFSAAASSATVTWAWTYGDGSPVDTLGASVTHTYTANGSYSVSVTATDTTTGGTVSGSVLLVVGNGDGGTGTPTASIAAVATKKKFTVNFNSPDRSKLDITLRNFEGFGYFDKFEFLDAVDGSNVRVYLGSGRRVFDTLEMFGASGFGDRGTLKWNFKKGEIRYQATSESVLNRLEDFGATDVDTAFKSVTVPIVFEVGNKRYGGDYTFSYKAKNGKGSGK